MTRAQRHAVACFRRLRAQRSAVPRPPVEVEDAPYFTRTPNAYGGFLYEQKFAARVPLVIRHLYLRNGTVTKVHPADAE